MLGILDPSHGSRQQGPHGAGTTLHISATEMATSALYSAPQRRESITHPAVRAQPTVHLGPVWTTRPPGITATPGAASRRVQAGRKETTMRSMFVAYLAVILIGLILFTIAGLVRS